MLRRRKHGTTDRLALPHQHRRKGEIAETVRSAPGRDPRMARFIRILTAMARESGGFVSIPRARRPILASASAAGASSTSSASRVRRRKRPLPRPFASYMARSADRSNSSAVRTFVRRACAADAYADMQIYDPVLDRPGNPVGYSRGFRRRGRRAREDETQEANAAPAKGLLGLPPPCRPATGTAANGAPPRLVFTPVLLIRGFLKPSRSRQNTVMAGCSA